MQSAAINQTLYKLISASDMKIARRLGESLTIVDITHGEKSARITPERGGRLLVIEYSGEVYELEPVSNKTLRQIAAAL